MGNRLYFKERQFFKTVYDADWIDYDLPIYSNDAASGTIHVYDPNDEILNSKLDLYWLCFGEHIYYVDGIDPQEDHMVEIKIQPPSEAFSRSHIDVSYRYANTGLFLDALFEQNYRDQSDTLYAMPYLISSANCTQTPTLVPDHTAEFMGINAVDGKYYKSGFFTMKDYIRKSVKNKVMIRFEYTSDTHIARIRDTDVKVYGSVKVFNDNPPERPITLIDGDGHTQKISYTYNKNVIEKVDVAILTKDSSGNQVVKSDNHYYYLKDGIEFQATVPENRKVGLWERTTIAEAAANSGDTDDSLAWAAARQIFEKNTEEMKIELYHDRFIEWGTPVRIKINNTIWTGNASSCKISSDDDRYYYTIGDLKTTMSEKLRGLL